MPCWLLREGSISDLKYLLIEIKNNKKASKRVMKNYKGNNKKAVKIRNFKMFLPFHKHLLFTGQQGKGVASSLIPLYHFYPLHRHLGISRENAAESSPPHIASSRTQIKNLWFLSPSR